MTGTMCKIATVVVNCLMWEKHASAPGMAALFVCLFAGMGYQQAPMREGFVSGNANAREMEKVKEKLIG